MREVKIEDHTIASTAALGGIAMKWGVNGQPDRLVFLPGGRVGMLELKRPGEEPAPLQAHYLAMYRRLGFVAGYADTFAKVDAFLQELAHA